MTQSGSIAGPAFEDLIARLASPGLAPSMADAMEQILATYGLRHVAYLALNLPHRREDDPYIATTYPDAWVEHYRAQAYHRHDPVVTEGLQSILPVDWAALDRSPKRVKRLFGEANEFGVGRQGLSFPIRGRFGERAIFTVTLDEPDRSWDRVRHGLMRDFHVIASYVHSLVLTSENIHLREVRLAPREAECLAWAARGKSAFETAKILGITRRTVVFYLEIARHKLDAVNTTHAVAKALSLNLISFG